MRATSSRVAVRIVRLGLVCAVLVASGSDIGARQGSEARSGLAPVSPELTPTIRPAIPVGAQQIWLVPDGPGGPTVARVVANFAAGVRLIDQEKYREALPMVSAAGLSATLLTDYRSYYTGVAQAGLQQLPEARATFARLGAGRPAGALAEAALEREAEVASAQGDHAAAARLYTELLRRGPASPDSILAALGRAHLAAGDRGGAAEAFDRLYYEHPLSDLAASVGKELEKLVDVPRLPSDRSTRLRQSLDRAERLYAARRFQPARAAYEALRDETGGDEADLVALRVAQCDFYLRHHADARRQLRPLISRGIRRLEARFFDLSAARELRRHEEYLRLARDLVTAVPDSPWAEETLNGLGTHHILENQDDKADAAFRELYARFPKGRFAERAAWKAGWYAYRNDRLADTVRFFESASVTFPRSDHRPAYLYWSARSRDRLGDRAGALSIYRIVVTDYLNSYYGRLAARRLQAAGVRQASEPPVTRPPASPASAPPTADLIRLLIAAGLYEQSRSELLYAQRQWGESPQIGATLGWVQNRLGNHRLGIIATRRAYPQYIADDGDRLPKELLRNIFPIDFWPLIRKYAPKHNLDPHVVAALINQESAFAPAARSTANAIGLMQLLPSTARRLARALGVPRFSTARLTEPEMNIRLGTAHFAELMARIGDLHLVLASYNAGEHRVSVWRAERKGLEQDEFIDDIPYPETQSYVKRILGTAEDYRRLYDDDWQSAASRAGAVGTRSVSKPGTARR